MIRVAEVADLEAIVSLEVECLGVDAWSAALVEQGLAGLPTVTYLVAVERDVVVGHAVVSEAGEIAELQRIAVVPDARRSGHASALLDEVVARSGRSGADRLLLEVRESNTGAMAFYASRDFVAIDRRPRYYRDGSAAIVMRRGLGPRCGGAS